MSTQAAFDKAVQIVKNLPAEGSVKPSQDEQLQYYGLFKQANEGDCTGERPGAFNFTAKYKYDAWKKLEGTSKEDAQKKYVELLEASLEKVNDADAQKYLAELKAAKA